MSKTIDQYTLTEEQKEIVDNLDDFQLLQVNILLYDWDNLENALENYEIVQVYQDLDYEDLAYELVEEGIFWDVSKYLENYIDYKAIARDLGFYYNEFDIDWKRWLYRIY